MSWNWEVRMRWQAICGHFLIIHKSASWPHVQMCVMTSTYYQKKKNMWCWVLYDMIYCTLLLWWIFFYEFFYTVIQKTSFLIIFFSLIMLKTNVGRWKKFDRIQNIAFFLQNLLSMVVCSGSSGGSGGSDGCHVIPQKATHCFLLHTCSFQTFLMLLHRVLKYS